MGRGPSGLRRAPKTRARLRPLAWVFLAGLLCLAAVQSAAGQPPGASPSPSQAPQDTSLPKTAGPGIGQGSDSLSSAPKSRTDSVIVVKHRFDHREQIITGSVVMTCLMLMMVTMNNYNPR
jgi:hypothetical protein